MSGTTSVSGGFRALADAQRRLPPLRSAALPGGPLEYLVVGDGAPVVVLISGHGVPIVSWALVIEGLQAVSTVFAYNRPGVGGSAPPQRPQTGTDVVKLLRATLAAAELSPPYVVVAHALGGLYGQLFARLHPEEVAGLVLLEATHPDDDPLERRLRLLPRSIARATTKAAGGRRLRGSAELWQMPAAAAEIDRAGRFPDIPLAVVSGAKTPSPLVATRSQVDRHTERQRDLAGLSPRGFQVAAPSSGYIPQVTDPATVVEAVRRVL